MYPPSLNRQRSDILSSSLSLSFTGPCSSVSNSLGTRWILYNSPSASPGKNVDFSVISRLCSTADVKVPYEHLSELQRPCTPPVYRCCARRGIKAVGRPVTLHQQTLPSCQGASITNPDLPEAVISYSQRKMRLAPFHININEEPPV